MGKKETLLTQSDIDTLNSFQTEHSGYFYKMLDYLHEIIERGVEEGRFTEEEARADCEIANWYAYACNNIDDYEHYYNVTLWMPSSEKNAAGCGTWYYRYSCALTYCGKLEEALSYAEKGVREEPEYPWGWLQLAKLRSHFGDWEGAFAANTAGLALVPGDYEFLRQEEELRKGYSLDMLEYHYINEENDKELLAGKVKEANEKLEAIAGIVCDEENLKKIKALLQPQEWEADDPYCCFKFVVQGRYIEGVFRMNEAALSKMDVDFIRKQLNRIEKERKDGIHSLQAVLFNRDKSVDQLYKNEETGEMEYYRIFPDGKRMEVQLNRQEETEEELPFMVKLYKKEKNAMYYAECWADGEWITEHIGKVGEQGEINQYPLSDRAAYEEFIFSFRARYGSLRYEEWEKEQGDWILIQFPAKPFDPEKEEPDSFDLERKDQVGSLLNEALGWTGFGEIDSWEIGKTAEDPEQFVLNLYCVTVEGKEAVKFILQTLSDNMDHADFALGIKFAGEEKYKLAYGEDGRDLLSVLS